MSPPSSAPTGHHVIAQSATLGLVATLFISPERAQSGCRGINLIRCRPFRARNHFYHLTHGVAMGYHISPRWGGIFICMADPMALPWAIEFRPVGAMIQQSKIPSSHAAIASPNPGASGFLDKKPGTGSCR